VRLTQRPHLVVDGQELLDVLGGDLEDQHLDGQRSPEVQR